ncbi:hypothetical protein FN846DRAFT_785993 [Sphaerosporella brunnea]|uniref:Uncharacterized protein n=1 Tax=Sphaerosporella brunnea TaxID=1250544 RepID=A0A5J5EHX8_9PEZI|nr:hypothetical protein FN846DRAFT_785993 [Sphaerosporella brunnea]
MLGIILFTLVFYSGVVASGSGDDFTNNLFSDLSPLLSLFGERFANQFMSQSMGWLDNIVFAMAPLGILTAMVAAIRVGGPSWLKAVIGRARENRATAELELMSSTSHEVGELWNGQTIVRTQGRPEIQQLIFLEHASNGPEFGLFSIPVAESGKYLKSESMLLFTLTILCTDYSWLTITFRSQGSISRVVLHPERYAFCHSVCPEEMLKLRQWQRLDTVAGETPDSGDTQPKAAPSISLNLHGGSKTGDLCFAAAFGVVLQSGVLVFTGLSVYYPTWNSRFRKDGLPVRSYAYPVMSIGTVLLTFGLVICSAVVERSTTETKWLQARILWLQKSHTVSDQSFDSFVIIAGDIKDSLLMSQRSTSHRIDSTTSKKIKAPSKLRKFASGPTELFTVLGVGLSLVGFIFQFQGLRGLHWSASIAQLVAIFLMTAVRAWVRRGLIVEPTAERVLDGYEMDWLAREMTAKPKFWSPSGNRTDEQLHESAQTMSQNGQDGKCDISWTISTGPSALACRGIWASRTVEHHGAAQKAMKVRQRLGDLTRWTGPASKPAISVASAISTIMEKLAITPPTEAGIFYWCLDASFTEKDQIGFAVSQSDGKWEADATAIEAAISLWAFHIRTTEECEKTQKSVDIATSTQDRSHHDWLQEDTLLRRQTRRILGPKTKALLMDLSLWIGDHLNPQPLETGDRATEEKETFLGFVGLTDGK